MSKISVVQVITTGKKGYPEDGVIQVGVAETDIDTHRIIDERLISVISEKNSCDQNQGDSVAEILVSKDGKGGLPLPIAADELRSFLKGKDVTSFDVKNTFSRYLVFEPWDLTYDVCILPSVSVHMPNNLRGRNPADENINIEKAYEKLVKKAIPERKDALTYARMTSELLINMRERGLY